MRQSDLLVLSMWRLAEETARPSRGPHPPARRVADPAARTRRPRVIPVASDTCLGISVPLLAHRPLFIVADAEAQRVQRAWAQDPCAATAALAAVREVRESVHVALLAATGLVPIEAAAREPGKYTSRL
jgi:hypothetical protein